MKQYLIPEVLSKIKGLDLKARLVVEGFLSGLHRSPYYGFSVEFADYRPYTPGDEIRRIDWKTYGRTDRYYIKEFEEETNLRAYILLDKSGSMSYRTGAISKYEYGQTLAASLAFLLIRQRDSVGLITFDEKLVEFVPPSARRSHIQTLLGCIDRSLPGGETDLGKTFFQLAERIKRRGLVIVISDLFDEPARIIRGLKSFRYRKHEIIVFQILDPQEWEFAFKNPARFVDLETRQELPIDPVALKESYKKRIREFVQTYEHSLREARIDYELIFTNIPFDRALLKFLARREKMF
ncbi:MAG: DUF58 domain-containing protein [candidate division WOR-3 bacterium]